MLLFYTVTLVLLVLLVPVLSYVGPDPPPSSPPVACSNPSADIQIAGFSKTDQQLIAERLGFINGKFSTYSISYCQVSGSSQQFYSLANGPYDVILTTFDNVINRQLNGLGEFQVLAAFDNNPGQIILATNGITSVSQLHGSNVLVDSPTSGFVLEFEGVASAYGLNYPQDFSFIAIGGGRQRFAGLVAGNVSVAGTVVSADAALVSRPYSALYIGAASAQPLTKIATITDFMAPLTGSILVAPFAFFTDSTKVNALREYIKGNIKGQAVLAQINNRAFVESVFATAEGVTTSQASILYQQLLDPIVGAVTTVPINLTVNTIAALNVAYLRQRFGGWNNPQQNFTALFEPGQGHFIDYTLRDEAYAEYLTEVAININLPASVTTKCFFPGLGQTASISNAVKTIAAGVSGGCTQNSTVVFTSCVASDINASPSQCLYDSSYDVLRVVASAPSHSQSRVYTATYTVSDICGDSDTVTQTITIPAPNQTHLELNECTLI